MLGAIGQAITFNRGESLILVHIRALIDRHRKRAAAQQRVCARVSIVEHDGFQGCFVITRIAADLSIRRAVRHEQADRAFIGAVALHDKTTAKL